MEFKIDLTAGKFNWNTHLVNEKNNVRLAVIFELPPEMSAAVQGTGDSIPVQSLSFEKYDYADMMHKFKEFSGEGTGVFRAVRTELITNDMLRPDCYFLFLPERNEAVAFHKLTDKELRFAHNLDRMFVAGHFGGKNDRIGY